MCLWLFQKVRAIVLLFQQSREKFLKQKYSIKNVKILGGPVYQQKFAWAVRQGNSELLSLLNEGLVVLKNSGSMMRYMKNGWYI
jgi:ABC-type amino acid transport substrate-binding protein